MQKALLLSLLKGCFVFQEKITSTEVISPCLQTFSVSALVTSQALTNTSSFHLINFQVSRTKHGITTANQIIELNNQSSFNDRFNYLTMVSGTFLTTKPTLAGRSTQKQRENSIADREQRSRHGASPINQESVKA